MPYPTSSRSRCARSPLSWSAVLLGVLSACDAGSQSSEGAGGSTSSGGAVSQAGTAGVGGAAAGGQGAGTPQTLSVAVSGTAPRAVAREFFGQNYWSWVKAWGNPVASVVTPVTEMGLRLLRAGGANNETGMPEPFSFLEVDAFVTFARAVAAEPLLQVSVINNHEGAPATAADAAALVRHVNVTKSYGIRYFSIGNEPDLYTEQGLANAAYDARAACATFAEYAEAMRAVDPDILLFGPELSWKYRGGNDWLTPFLTNCGDQLDVVAVHRYPFAPTACTTAAAYADAATFRQTIAQLRATMAATGQADKPLAITEANITYDGEPEKSTLPASPGTFPAGLWVADSLGVALEEELHSISYWSLSEGWTLGFFAGTEPRPAAHVLKLFATRFGSQVLEVTGATSGVSIYAGREPSAGKTTLFIVNKTESHHDVSVALIDLPRTDSPVVAAPAISLTVVELSDDGSAPVLVVYHAGMAAPAAVP